jgi:hypothetical protein
MGWGTLAHALDHALDPYGLGHAAHSLVGSGTPGLETPTMIINYYINDMHILLFC